MSKKIFIALFVVFVSFGATIAQKTSDTKYWILFNDKGEFKPDENMSPGSKGYVKAGETISERAVQRRLKVLTAEKLFDYRDLPVENSYVKKVTDAGISVIAESRWLNGVSAYLSSEQAETLRSFPFVKKVEVVQKLYRQEADTDFEAGPEKIHDYGNSQKQMELVNVPKVHELGINGKGILIACFDDGFDWRNHESLRDLNVIDEYDFINRDKRTYYEENQRYRDERSQGQHGTAVISTMSGYKEGKLVGPAYGADILLAKTEYIPTETPMEEDFWLEATEWAEAKGADVITSSLIYKGFDSPYDKNSYTYDDFNGKVAVTSFAATRAAHLGVVVCQAMGNYFQTDVPSLGSAADADSIISVGAIAPNGKPANFTSNGPTKDGRIKPDVSAPGVMVFAALVKELAGDDSTYEYTSGTSFATPITAGVCALILSAHPELTPLQVREALRNTASKSDNPDNTLGWGIVNAYDALLYHGPVWSNVAQFSGVEGGLEVKVKMASNTVIDPSKVKLHYRTSSGDEYSETVMTYNVQSDANGSGEYVAKLDLAGSDEELFYYFSAADNSGNLHKSPERSYR